MTSLELKIQKIHPKAVMPQYANPGDAGMDLCSVEDYNLSPGAIQIVKTGLQMEIPFGYAGIIKPKSGLAVKNGIDTMAGVIDSGYRGEVGVVLINHGKGNMTITPGQKVAQMVIYQVHQPKIVEASKLEESVRGSGGYGSSGTHVNA